MSFIPRKLHQRIAEDIALRYLAGESSEATPRDQNTKAALRGMGYTLGLDYERDLVGALAYVSQTREHADRVTAVAVHEEGSALRVLLAANDTTSSGLSCLENTRAGMLEVTDILRRAPETNRELLSDAVFRSIVKLCRTRILGRLRIPLPWGKKTHWDELLFATKAKLESSGPPLTAPIRAFCAAVTELGDQVARLRNDRDGLTEEEVDERLRGIITLCHDLVTREGVEDGVCARLREAKEVPSTGEGIWRKLRKVRHYKTCAGRLVKMAREQPLVRAMDPVIVHLPPEDRNPCPLSADMEIPKILGRVCQGVSGKQQKSWALAQAEKTSKSGVDRRARACVAFQPSAKIHAEIQIMRHVDSRPEMQRPPRVIRATKSTCFLCHTFMATDGRYDMGKSHGKVYPGWRLPARGDAEVYRRFAERLEQGIRSHVKGRAPGCQPTNVHEVCESLLPTPGASLASISTIVPDRPSAGTGAGTETGSGPGASDVTMTTRVKTEASVVREPRGEARGWRLEQGVSQSSRRAASRRTDGANDGSRSQKTHHIRPSKDLELFVDHSVAVRDHDPRALCCEEAPLSVLLLAADDRSGRAQEGETVYDLDQAFPPGEEIKCPVGIRSFCLKLKGRLYRVELKPRS